MRAINASCPECEAKLYESFDGDTVCGVCAFRVRNPSFVHPREKYSGVASA